MYSLIILTALLFACLLPRGTNIRYASPPVITMVLIGLNVGLHLVSQIIEIMSATPVRMLTTGNWSDSLYRTYITIVGLTPAMIDEGGGWRYIQVLTCHFFHTNWMHLIFNIWYFYLFAVNLEDHLGRLRFSILLIVSALLSAGAVLTLTLGTSGYDSPHIGFSGLVYAALGAYLVCFPRSSIRVVLIYDIFFWAAVFVAGGVAAGIAYFFVRSLSDVVFLAVLVILYSVMEPPHISFGIPAFIFLGHRILYDAVTIESQLESQTSVWMHAGGLVGGVLVALAFNGLKGLKFKPEDEDEPPERVSLKEKQRHREVSLAEAAATDQNAAAELLNRIVFLANGAAAARMYRNLVLEKHRNLVLAAPQQLILARLLETQREPGSALHALTALIERHPNDPSVEQALMPAARLCLNNPDRITDGIAYVDRYLAMDILNRDRIEANSLRESLVAAAAALGSKTLEQVAETTPALPTVGEKRKPAATNDEPHDHWGKRIALTENPSPRKPLRTIRTEELDPTETANPGWRRVTPKVLPRQPDETPAADAPPPVPDPAAAADDAPVELPMFRRTRNRPIAPDEGMDMRRISFNQARTPKPQTEPPAHEVESGPRTLLPRKPASSPPDDEVAKRQAHLPTREMRDAYAAPTIGGIRATPLSKSSPAASGSATWDPALHAVVTRQAAIPSAASSETLARLLRAAGLNTDTPLFSPHSPLLLCGLSAAEADLAARVATDAGVPAVAVSQDYLALNAEPSEVAFVRVETDELAFHMQNDVARVTPQGVALLHFSAMRLSPQSRRIRHGIDIITGGGQPRRFQVWDTSFNAQRCVLFGNPASPEDALFEILNSLQVACSAAVLTPPAEAMLSGTTPKVFPSFQDYENAFAAAVLVLLAKAAPET